MARPRVAGKPLVMEPGRYEVLQKLFERALPLSGAERMQFLDGVTAELRRPLEELLAEDEAGSILDQGAAPVARDLLQEDFVGRQCGPYRLESRIGEGGMGVVFLGHRDDLDSVAAIKILRHAWMSSVRMERFLSEQRTLAELRHPGIAALYDAGSLSDGTPWFAMEYVDGVPLTEFCANLGLQERLRAFRPVCEAVRYAHSHAVIHRDLKPSNILVDFSGQPKLLDFGIAKQLGRADHTQTGVRLMTPAYAAPEQERGEPTGVYTDIFALGLLLRELTDGVRASRAEQADLRVLCQKAAHPDAARRYASVDALIRDLDNFSRGAPLEARPDEWLYRAGKFVRRNKSTVAAMAAITVLSVAYAWNLNENRKLALAEAARSKRMMRFVLDLFQGGDSYAGPAADLKVQTLVDRGVDQARAMTGDPEVQAELYRTLGGVQQKLGNLDKAETLLTSALSLRGESHSGGYAESLRDLAMLRAEQARFEEAETQAREALALARRTNSGVAEALVTLGKVLEERGNYPAAITAMTEAVALRSKPEELADARIGLANVYFYAGKYAESEALNRQVLEAYRQIYGPGHPAVAEVLTNLGAIQQDTGNYAEAERLHREGNAIIQAFFGEDHPRTAANVTMIARALVFQKRGPEATHMLGRALAIRERVYGPSHPSVASTLNEMGNLAIMLEDYVSAERQMRRVVAIYRAAYNGKHYLIGIGLANLASVFLARKQWREAEPLLREALDMYARTLPADHVNFGITRIKLGRALLRQQRYREAQAESRAGFEIVSRQANPAVSWLNNARKDLEEEEKGLRGTFSRAIP